MGVNPWVALYRAEKAKRVGQQTDEHDRLMAEARDVMIRHDGGVFSPFTIARTRRRDGTFRMTRENGPPKPRNGVEKRRK